MTFSTLENISAMNNRSKASARLDFSKLVLGLTGILLTSSVAIAAAASSAQASPFSPAITLTKQARRGQVPGRRRGGARRGTCPESSTQLTALAPETEVATQTLPEIYVGGTTAAEYPTLWFSIPYALTDDLPAEFILQNDQGQDIYRVASTDFPVSERTPGVIGVSLPAEAPLEVGQTYQWYFKLNCSSEAPLYVQGGIERIALSPGLASQLASASPSEQAALYQQNDLWYDAVTVLAQQRRSSPNNPAVESAWTSLLQTVGL